MQTKADTACYVTIKKVESVFNSNPSPHWAKQSAMLSRYYCKHYANVYMVHKKLLFLLLDSLQGNK